MAQGIYTKWLIGGIILLIMVSGVCYLWYQHDTAPYRKEAVKADELARQWETAKKKNIDSDTKQAIDATFLNKTVPITEEISEVGFVKEKNTDNPVEDMSSTNKAKERVEKGKVSPHGLGPFPDIPEGCPVNPNAWGVASKEMEMLFRVAIKKWNAGERFSGASIDDGKVYLHYPDTIYVQYRTVKNLDGTISKRITHTKSGNISLTQDQMMKGLIPKGIRVLELSNEGINPYEYLELQ